MTAVKVYEPPIPHVCSLPHTGSPWREGTVVVCDDCWRAHTLTAVPRWLPINPGRRYWSRVRVWQWWRVRRLLSVAWSHEKGRWSAPASGPRLCLCEHVDGACTAPGCDCTGFIERNT